MASTSPHNSAPPDGQMRKGRAPPPALPPILPKSFSLKKPRTGPTAENGRSWVGRMYQSRQGRLCCRNERSPPQSLKTTVCFVRKSVEGSAPRGYSRTQADLGHADVPGVPAGGKQAEGSPHTPAVKFLDSEVSNTPSTPRPWAGTSPVVCPPTRVSPSRVPRQRAGSAACGPRRVHECCSVSAGGGLGKCLSMK